MVGFLFSFFDVIFAPVLALNPIIAILILVIIISLIFTLSSKLLVNQAVLRQIKKETKSIQEKINKAKKSKNEKKIQEYWKKSMELTQKQFKMTMKPMIVSTFLIILLFPWMQSQYADITTPLENQTAIFEFGGVTEILTVTGYDENNVPSAFIDSTGNQDIKLNGKILLDGEELIILYKKKGEKETLSLRKLEVNLPFPLPFAGDKVSWFGLYIILSMPCTVILRYILGVE